jgi:hypothetical protein
MRRLPAATVVGVEGITTPFGPAIVVIVKNEFWVGVAGVVTWARAYGTKYARIRHNTMK